MNELVRHGPLASKRVKTCDQHIAARVRLARLKRGLSQSDLANQLGLTSQQIRKYENAENRISAGRLFEIAHILQTPINFFFEGPLLTLKHLDDPAD
jgi:transcriptional regulator with XRE-family HTH domain